VSNTDKKDEEEVKIVTVSRWLWNFNYKKRIFYGFHFEETEKRTSGKGN